MTNHSTAAVAWALIAVLLLIVTLACGAFVGVLILRGGI